MKTGKKVVTVVASAPENAPAEVDPELGTKSQEQLDTAFEGVVKRALQPVAHQDNSDDVDLEVECEGAFWKNRTILTTVYLFSDLFVCILVMDDSLKSPWWLGDSYWHKIWFFRLWMWGDSILLAMQFLGCICQKFVSLRRHFYYQY